MCWLGRYIYFPIHLLVITAFLLMINWLIVTLLSLYFPTSSHALMILDDFCFCRPVLHLTKRNSRRLRHSFCVRRDQSLPRAITKWVQLTTKSLPYEVRVARSIAFRAYIFRQRLTCRPLALYNCRKLEWEALKVTRTKGTQKKPFYLAYRIFSTIQSWNRELAKANSDNMKEVRIKETWRTFG